jgi:hypothetical protein
MRWDHLFDDLESQIEQELAADEIDVMAEEERLRLGRLGLRDRLQAMHTRCGGQPVRLLLTDGSALTLVIGAVGRDWIAGEVSGGGAAAPSGLVPIVAIAAVLPDAAQAADSVEAPEAAGTGAPSLSARLGLGFVLRDLCRRRAPVRITTPRDDLHGTIDRVSRDHLDLAEHEPGMARRERAVRARRILPLSQLLLVRY